jgi:hypothetical protein
MNIGLLPSLDAFNPPYVLFVKFDIVETFALQYAANMRDLEVVMWQTKMMIQRKS